MKKILFILICLVLVSGCRSKKKISEREKSKTEISQVLSTTEVATTDTKKDSVVNTKTETVTVTNQQEVDIIADENSSEVVVKEEITPKGKTYTFTGAKSISIRDKKVDQTVKDTSSIVVAEVDNSETVKTEDSVTEIKEEKKSRNTDSEAKGMSFGFTLGIGLGLIGLLTIWYFKRKKNQFIG